MNSTQRITHSTALTSQSVEFVHYDSCIEQRSTFHTYLYSSSLCNLINKSHAGVGCVKKMSSGIINCKYANKTT